MGGWDRPSWYHSNSRFAAENFCKICDRPNDRHKPWCAEVNERSNYAWALTTSSQFMTEEDRVHMRGMGILW